MQHDRQKRVRIRIAEVAILYLFWCLCTDSTSRNEMYVGAAAAVLAAAGAEVVRGLRFARFRPRLAWLLEGWRIPGMVAEGCWALVRVLLARHVLGRNTRGELKTVPFEPGGKGARSAARRALAIAFTTLAPNFIVVRIDPKERLMLYHQVLASRVPTLTKQLGARP